MLSTGRKVSICVEPLLFNKEPSVGSTRAKVAAWCHDNLKSATFEVSAVKVPEWTIMCAYLEVLCLLPEDAKAVRRFFTYDDDIPF